MKKFISSKIVSLALVFAMALMTAGCGASDGGASKTRLQAIMSVAAHPERKS